MPLDAKKPQKSEKRFKAIIFGEPSTFKTFTSIQFPNPYLIDTEGGAKHDQYVDMINEKNGAVLETDELNQIVKNVQSLATEQHPYKTLIIDSATILYKIWCDEGESTVGNVWAAHTKYAEKKLRHLYDWLRRIDMNVIVIAHSRKKYESRYNAKGKLEVVDVGNQADLQKGIDYAFDLIIEVKRENNKRIAKIYKSRITEFKENDIFEFDYPNLTKRYDENALSRALTPDELATPEQIDKLQHLISILHIQDSEVAAWLRKAKADSIANMHVKYVVKCIEALNKKVGDFE